MKSVKLRKAVALGAAIIMCGQSFLFQPTVNAATNTELTMKASDVPVSITEVKYTSGKSLNIDQWIGTGWTTVSGGKYRPNVGYGNSLNSSSITTEVLRRYNVTADVTFGDANMDVNTVINMIKLKVVSQTSNIEGGSQQYNVTATKSNNTFKISSTIISYGTSVKLSYYFANSNSKPITITNAAISGADVGYKKVYTSYNGENVFAMVPPMDSSVTNTKIIEWAQRTCMYLNSLADVTGISHGKVYIAFNDPLAGCPNCDHFVMSNDVNHVVVRYPISYIFTLADAMEKSYMDWGEMHEVSHCYSFTGNKKLFAQTFNYNLDDVNTNVRGMTALQNCTALQNLPVYMNNNTAQGGLYNQAIQKVYSYNQNDDLFRMANVFAKYACANYASGSGWSILEDYFKGGNGYKMNNEDLSAAVNFAQLDVNYGTTWKFGSADTYRFINGLSYLADCSNQDHNFYNFLYNVVGKVNFKSFVVNQSNNSALGEAIISSLSGDVNLDGTVNSNDKTLLGSFMSNSTTRLAPEAIFNADKNKDGFVNMADYN